MNDIKKAILKHDPIREMEEEHHRFLQRKIEKKERYIELRKKCVDYAKSHNIEYKFTFYISGIKTRVKHHQLQYGEKLFTVNETGFSIDNNLSEHYRTILWEKVYLYLSTEHYIIDDLHRYN